MLTKGFQKAIPVSHYWLYLTHLGTLSSKAFLLQINAVTHGRQLLSHKSHQMYFKVDYNCLHTTIVLLAIRWCIKSWTTLSGSLTLSYACGSNQPTTRWVEAKLEEAVTIFFRTPPFTLFGLPPIYVYMYITEIKHFYSLSYTACQMR